MNLKQIVNAALDSMPISKVADFVIESHRQMFDIWARGAFNGFIGRIVARRKSAEFRANPVQAWLPLPDLKDFQHIPVAVRKDSLEEFRERIAAKEREINSYKRARLSLQKERIAKRELREMRMLERKIAPFFAKDPTMTVERAIELYRQQLASPMFRKGKKAIEARWQRRKAPTKNQ